MGTYGECVCFWFKVFIMEIWKSLISWFNPWLRIYPNLISPTSRQWSRFLFWWLLFFFFSLILWKDHFSTLTEPYLDMVNDRISSRATTYEESEVSPQSQKTQDHPKRLFSQAHWRSFLSLTHSPHHIGLKHRSSRWSSSRTTSWKYLYQLSLDLWTTLISHDSILLIESDGKRGSQKIRRIRKSFSFFFCFLSRWMLERVFFGDFWIWNLILGMLWFRKCNNLQIFGQLIYFFFFFRPSSLKEVFLHQADGWLDLSIYQGWI